MPNFTTNINNRYTVSVIEDPTGGDGVSTPSGYESVYVMEIIPNPGEVIIAGDLLLDSTSFFSITPPIFSLHGLSTVSGTLGLQGYTIPNPVGHSEISVVDLYEVYEDDLGNEWDFLQGPQPIITTNINPIKLRLYIYLATSFTNTTPFVNTTINLDIDLISLTPIYGCTDSSAFNFNSNANTDDGSCLPVIVGCMDTTSDTYDATANTSDATLCEYHGCLDPNSMNYNISYTHDCGGNLTNIDTTCCQFTGVCNTAFQPTTGFISLNYDPTNNVDCSGMPGSVDDSCCHWAVPDCLDPTAANYNYNAYWNTVNGVLFNVDCDGILNSPTPNFGNCCNYITNSCTDPSADNYDATADHDCNGDYIFPGGGGGYVQAPGWDSCCTYAPIYGCMDFSWAGSYFSYTHPVSGTVFQIDWRNPSIENLSTDPLSGCWPNPGSGPQTENPYGSGDGNYACWGNASNEGYLYEDINLLATAQGVGDCVVGGCMDPLAFNYDSRITYDNGSCIYFGCMDSTSSTYAAYANADSVLHTDTEIEDALTFLPFSPPTPPTYDPANGIVGDCAGGYILGCTDPAVSNYDAAANVDDGSCCVDGCMDDGNLTGSPYISPFPGTPADNYNPLATCDDGSCTYATISYGCTDSLANNYDPTAGVDDGSCSYSVCTDDGLNSNGNIAALNYELDCSGVDRSSALTLVPSECDVLPSGYPFGTYTASRDCQYSCATITSSVDPNTGFVVIDIDASLMPDDPPAGWGIYWRYARINMRYAETGTTTLSSTTAKGYHFDVHFASDNIQLILDPNSGWSVSPGTANFGTNIGPTNPLNQHWNSPMQPITYVTTPNSLSYKVSHTVWAGATDEEMARYAWYWQNTIVGTNPFGVNIYQNRSDVCQGTSFNSVASVYGCTDSTSANYNSLATIDDGSCISCSCCSSYTITQQYVLLGSCTPTLEVTIDNLETTPGCIPCEFPSSIDLLVEDSSFIDSSGNPVILTCDQSMTFQNSSGAYIIQSGNNFPFTPLTIFDSGGVGSVGSTINSFPIVLQYILDTQGSTPAINTSSCSHPFAGYDIDGKTYTTRLTTPSCSAVDSAPLVASFTTVNGCSDPSAINYDPLANCGISSCYYCPNPNSQNPYLNVVTAPEATVYTALNTSPQPSIPLLFLDHNTLNINNFWSGVPPHHLNITIVGVTNFSGYSGSYGVNYIDYEQFVISNSTLPAILGGGANVSAVWEYLNAPFGSNADLDDSSVPAIVTYNLQYWWVDLSGNWVCSINEDVDIEYYYGCTDPNASNHNPIATVDDGSCIAIIYGCMQPCAVNYYFGATMDDGSCIHVGQTSTEGGQHPDVNNFCSDAVFGDGSGSNALYDCNDPAAFYASHGTYYHYNSAGIFTTITSTPSTGIPPSQISTGHSCDTAHAIGSGPDLGYNCPAFDPIATIDDGSCI